MKHISFGIIVTLLASVASASATKSAASTTEPNVEIAKTWWPPQRNVWTPIGWKDHQFRYNVLYNGTIIVAPQGGYERDYRRPYSTHTLQLSFTPGAIAGASPLPKITTKLYHMDGGHGQQGWDEEKNTPVLWTEWPRQDGVIIKQEIFSHVKGGKSVETALEPHYAWIRLSVSHVDPRRAPKDYFVTAQFSRQYIQNSYPFGLDDSVTLEAIPTAAPLHDSLSWQSAESPHILHQVTMPDGRVRAVVLPGTSNELTFSEDETSGIYQLAIKLPSKVGAFADILVPFIPEESAVIAQEVALGRDGALAESEKFWSFKPETAEKGVGLIVGVPF